MAIRLDPVPQVWGITGNLGGGKTLTAVNLAVTAMNAGMFVCSNIELNMDAICRDYGDWMAKLYLHFDFDDDFDPSKLPSGSPRGSRGGKRVLVILDEVAEWMDQYSTLDGARKRFFSWLRHSSKRSQDVVLVVQRLDFLNKNLRILVAKWLIVDDLKVYRIPVIKTRCLGFGGFCMQRVFDRTKRLIQGPCIVRKKTWGRYYYTAQCLATNIGSAFEYEKPNLYYSPWMFATIAALSLLALFLVLCLTESPAPVGVREIEEIVNGIASHS